jgi:5-(carboxyamino)imidazole ribonucleotide mutase
MAEQAVVVVGIIMGSDSDWAVMEAASKQLDSLGIAHEVDVVSAHRTPDVMVTYARSAADRGLRVIIAGAGGAAHLPGMVASMTSLPVIGVPVPLTTLDGMDSLLSIVQMPTGVPVATVAIGNAANAALLAARIIGSGTSQEDLAVRAALDVHRETMTDEVTRKGEALRARRTTKTGF